LVTEEVVRIRSYDFSVVVGSEQ